MDRLHTRIYKKHLNFIGDDMVIRDVSVYGLGVWHSTTKPLERGDIFYHGVLIYTVKWTKQIHAGLVRYGAILFTKDTF